MQRAEAELAARRQNRGQTLMELLERFVAAWEAEQARKAQMVEAPSGRDGASGLATTAGVGAPAGR